ncbi:MAG: S8 family serine peptidase [Phycisphaerae bacterium]|nr:S8 family serine peptidase [Phycisphaerae bacterium]
MRLIAVSTIGLAVILLGTMASYGQVAAEDTSELIVFLKPGTDAKGFAAARGLTVKRALRSDPNAYVMAAADAKQARARLNSMRATAKTESAGPIRSAYANAKRHYVLDAFVPNDPYFHKDTPSAPWPGQWHLVNEHTPGLDARVEGAWNRNATGGGVVIGICDDGLQTAHPDLAPNYLAAHSWDFYDDDSDPNPAQTADKHGTAVAGVAAARGGNGIGVTGAAPYANLAGLRLPFHVLDQDAADFVDATLYHSSGSNTSIKIKNHSYSYTKAYYITDVEADALATSTAAGTIHCWSAGNQSYDCNVKDLQNEPGAITVSALGSDGQYASYSNYGACVFVTAPSDSDGLFGITTTDRTTEASGYNGSMDDFPDPDYTSDFGGTSSASPLVAGVLAMAKQVQPALDTRFAKHLLARTSAIVNSDDSTPESDGGWRTNAAGFHFNQRYGFGLIDADQLTSQAVLYAGPTTQTTQTTGTVAVNQTLADNGTYTVQFSFSAALPLEEVLVDVDFETTNTYPVELNLTSPSGYRTRLIRGINASPFEPHARVAWQYCTNALWGENPAGIWTLEMEDIRTDAKQVTWHSYRVTARMGTLTYNDCITAPTNVSATDGTYEYTRVTWTGVSGATHYRVYRATANNFELAMPISGWQTGTSFDDTDNLPLTAYYYWVRASADSSGLCGSLASNSDLGWSKLRAPTSVSASDGTTTAGVEITWDAAPSATHYRVYRNDVDNPAFAIPISSWQTSLSYLDSSSAASPGVLKYYWVCSAISSTGQAASWFSEDDTGYRKLAPPTNVQASQGAFADLVRITWTATPGASHYLVYRNSTDNPASAVAISSWFTGTSFDDIMAEPCEDAYYWVRAAVNIGGSRPSDVSASASGYRPMPAPTNVSASDGTFLGYCRVTWDAVPGATHYRVWRSTTNDPQTADTLGSWRTETSYDDTSAISGAVYYYWVTAANDAFGTCASFKSESDSGWRGLSPPSNVYASDGTMTDRVFISWSQGTYDRYHMIYRGLTDDATQAEAITGWFEGGYYEDFSGAANVQYYYFVKAAIAEDGTGETDFSVGVLGWRTMVLPSNLIASDGKSTEYVRVTWDAGEPGLWYQLYRGTSDNPKLAGTITSWLLDIASRDDTTAVPGTTYYYWIKAATNPAGTDASATIGGDTGWRALAGPTASASNGTYVDRVTVSWAAVSGASYYRVYRSATSSSSNAVSIGGWQSAVSFDDTTAEPGLLFHYFIKAAIDRFGDRASNYGPGAVGMRARDCNGNGVPDQNDPDDDTDGIPDGCDLCPNTVPGSPVDADGCPPLIPGDYDRDGDVDTDDFAEFEACASGPGISRSTECSNRDFDSDNDVDQSDFGVFQRCYSGENVPADPNCAT